MTNRMPKKKLNCIILVMALVALTLAPCNIVFAEEDIEPTVENAPYRVAEITELREKNADTYLLSDGTYESVVYAEDKYYQNDNGDLTEISNSIVPTEHKSGATTYKYVNEANATKVYFSDEKPQVLLTSGKESLEFSLVDAKSQSPQSGSKGNAYKFDGFDLSAENCITYEDVCESTDLIYSVHTGYVKEYIILKNANAPSTFRFKFDTKNCYIKKNERGSLDVYNSNGELVFEFASLFAVDSAGVRTESLRYEISEVSKDSTVVNVVIDRDYLLSRDRVFPILVDPTVMVTGGWCTYDTYVSQRYPNTNFYLENWLRTGRDEDFYTRRTYIQFDLPSYITSSAITSAFIGIKKYSGSAPTIKAYRVTGSWSSSTLTWNNKPNYTTTNASYNAAYDADNWYILYVTNIVKSWYAGTYNNYGFVLRDAIETGTSQWTTFYSSDAASPNKPELHIRYTNNSPATYTITYNGNGNTGGSIPASQSATSGSSITLMSNTGGLSKSGYSFYGWNTNSSGTGTTYMAGQTITMPSHNMTLYAKWVKKYNMAVYYTPGITNAEKTRMNNAIDTAVETYLEYGIQIVPSTPIPSAELNYRTTSTTCAVTSNPYAECTGTCGSRSSCASNHHRNCTYYLNKLTSSQRVLRIVDWALCNTVGTADGYTNSVGGKNMVCNVNRGDLAYLIVHEFAHTLGLKDGYDGSEPNCLGECVMNGRPLMKFCDYCKTRLPH